MMQTDVPQIMQTAIAHHQAGRLAEAEALYRQVLARFPRHPDALHMLGLLAHHLGRNDVAVHLIGQAIRITPKHAACHSNLGNVLKAQGRLDEAIRSYRRALKLSPSFADAHRNLGNALQAKGMFDEACRSHRRALALDPDNAGGHYNLGNIQFATGDFDGALESYRRAIALSPGYADAHNNLGNALQAKGQLEEALLCYRRALELRPDYAEAYNNIGLVRAAQYRHDEAIESIQKAIAARPDYAEAYQNLGTQYEARDMPEQALVAYRKAVALKPDFAVAYNNIGNALLSLGDLAGSLEAYQRSLALNPQYAEAHSNLGNLYQTMGRLEESISSYDRALALHPGWPDALWNKAYSLLLAGDYAAGWALAESRWKFEDPRRVRRSFPQPAWLGGAPVAGRTVLLHHEQGLGDTLQMLRYAPLLAAQGARVIVLVPASLAAVAATVPGVSVVASEGDPLPAFDLHCPFMSLPLAFGTRLDSVPAGMPYIFAPGPAQAAWRERFGARRGRRIGLVWSGSTTHRNDRHRSVALQRLLPLLDQPDEFYSLQKEYRPADIAFMQADVRLHDLSAQLGDFADTAGLIDQLDLVISVDTAVAHLAGAMGKPVWLLLPFAPDYRWLLGRTDSPWYPTLRLFRQSASNDWDTVIRRVAAALVDDAQSAAPEVS